MNFTCHASLQKAQKGESAWLAAEDAAIQDISEIEDNISLKTEEEDEEEEGTEAANDEVMPTKSPSPLDRTFFSPSHKPSPLQQGLNLADVTNAPQRVQHGSLQELKGLRETVCTL